MNEFSKFLLGAVSVVALTTNVFAADAIVEEVPVAVLVESYDWTGFYVGVNGGYGGGDFEHPFGVDAFNPEEDDFQRILDGSLDISASGFLGGGQVGYNWQSGQWVFGAEADIQASNIKGELSANISTPDDFGGFDAEAEAGTKLDYFGTIRARIGFLPVERLLVYGTGGFAYGRTESYISASIEGDTVFDESTKSNRTGWTIGGGAEYAFTDNWSLKTEYLYTDLGSEDVVSGPLFSDFIEGSLESDVKFHTVRAGLNYKF
jgi:outer membrane immunogenic protein